MIERDLGGMGKDKLDQWIKQAVHNEKGPKKSGFFYRRKKRGPVRSFFRGSGQKSLVRQAGGPARPGSGPVRPRTTPPLPPLSRKLRIIPLGGLEEIGKNMMVLEYGPDLIIVDMGLQFPEEDMLGIDYVIPDISYLEDKINRIRGIIITHGHLDHIGAIPYLLPALKFPPLFGTKLTLGLVKKRVEEFGLERKTHLHEVSPAKPLTLGPFRISFFHVNHSIPDGVGLLIQTPVGNLVHTGDFKFDLAPADDRPADLSKIAALGEQNILALFSDSTNALIPGTTISEKQIGETLDQIVKEAPGRIIIACFASLIGRIHQIIESAARYQRKVFLSGRSMEDNVAIAQQLGYLRPPAGILGKISKLNNFLPQKVLVLTTGSQGESLSALTRIALSEHSQIKIRKGDTVILSSSPIIGNEKAISTVINNLCRQGAKVISSQIMDVHTSGHGQRDDLKMMISLVKPKYLVPIHGELYMRLAHKEIAESLGMKEENIILLDNGDVLEITPEKVHKPRERVPSKYIMVDGLGVGDVGAQVLMDRQIMAENGILVLLFVVNSKTNKLLYSPDVISRGFVYMKESQEIIEGVIKTAESAYYEIINKNPGAERGEIKKHIRSAVDRLVHKRIDRHPLVVPVLAKV